MTNAQPYSFVWDTSDCVDGEHVIEIVDEDENNGNLHTNVQHVWVDNAGKLE